MCAVSGDKKHSGKAKTLASAPHAIGRASHVFNILWRAIRDGYKSNVCHHILEQGTSLLIVT